MKYLIVAALSTVLVVPCIAQSHGQYINIAEKLVKYYNQREVDSFNLLFESSFHTGEDLKRLHDTFGQVAIERFMLFDSTDFDIQNRPMAYFKTQCAKEWQGTKKQAMAFTVTPGGKIFGLRFMTKSPHVDSLLNKY
jgi:hypothetical protein